MSLQGRAAHSRPRRRPPAAPAAPAGPDASPFAPETVAIGARHVEVGTDHVASFAVIGYPREVAPGWLGPLLSHPGRLDVSVHVEPIDPVTAASGLRTRLAKLESGRRHTAEHGRLLDPYVEAATEDAYDLSHRVARGEGKLFRLGLYLTVHASDTQALADEVAAVRALAASLLLDARPTTWRALQGWTTTLPLGIDAVTMRRTFDTEAVSAAFPFLSPDLPTPDPVAGPDAGADTDAGVLYGRNLGSSGLVWWDRFAPALHNHNSVILARSGAGKSYLAKVELLRSLHRGVEVAVVDPEDEYSRLADAVGGRVIRLGADGVRLNPFDLPLHTGPGGRRAAASDALTRRSLFLHTVLTVLLGEVSGTERAALDRAITGAYQAVGIHPDPRTWTRPAPTLHTLRDVLTADARTADPRTRPVGADANRAQGHGAERSDRAGAEVAAGLAARLHPFVEGAFGGLFDGATTTAPDGHLVVFSLRELPDELKSIGTLLTLDSIWRRVSNPAARRPRLVVVDEAWLLMRQPAGAQFLARMAKAARKHWAGLTVATQDTADLLASDLGRAVVANSATQILLRQAPQAVQEIATVFALSHGERQFLLTADRGQGLLVAGVHRVAFQVVASGREDGLVTSSPAQLAAHTAPAPTGWIDLGPDTGPDPGPDGDPSDHRPAFTAAVNTPTDTPVDTDTNTGFDLEEI